LASAVSPNVDPEEPGRDGGAPPTRVFCRGLPTVGGPRVDVGGGAGIGLELNWSKTSVRLLDHENGMTKYLEVLPSRSSKSSSRLIFGGSGLLVDMSTVSGQ
jgi:hypothetical protein